MCSVIDFQTQMAMAYWSKGKRLAASSQPALALESQCLTLAGV